jgi:hypothetical protein
MKVTLTLQQLHKVSSLDAASYELMLSIIKAGGIKEIARFDQGILSPLRSLNLVKCKRDKAWVAFAVNGMKPSPFMGHKTKRASTDPAKCAGMFAGKFKKAYGKSYGTLNALEWVFVSRLCKQFDLAELDSMIGVFFGQTTFAKASIQMFYNVRNRLLRELTQNQQEHVTNESGEEPEEGGDWAALDAASKDRDTSSLPRRKSPTRRSRETRKVLI